jgi:hypothetical protein
VLEVKLAFPERLAVHEKYVSVFMNHCSKLVFQAIPGKLLLREGQIAEEEARPKKTGEDNCPPRLEGKSYFTNLAALAKEPLPVEALGLMCWLSGPPLLVPGFDTVLSEGISKVTESRWPQLFGFLTMQSAWLVYKFLPLLSLNDE